jgi:hypothetical protein
MKYKHLMAFMAIIKSLFLIFLSHALAGQTNSNARPAVSAVTEQHKMLARSNGSWTGQVTF